MEEYFGTARTNYFRVTNEERYQELFKHLAPEDEVRDFTKEQDGVIYHGFGTYRVIDYKLDLEDEESEYDFDYFLQELQKILPEDEAFVYQELGHERLRFVDGCAFVVTSKEIRSECLTSWVKETVKELLGKNNKVIACSY